MGFNDVYMSLQELFPQIDARALRAVAIEHSKDPDAAVEAVLEEIIPFLTEISRPSRPLTGNSFLDQSTEEAITAAQSVDGLPVNATGSAEEIYEKNLNDGNHQSHDGNDECDESFFDTYNGQNDGEDELPLSEKFSESSIKISADKCSHGQPAILLEENMVTILHGEASVYPMRTETISAGKCPEDGIKTCQTPGTPEYEYMGVDHILSPVQEIKYFDAHVAAYIGTDTCKEYDRGMSCMNGNTVNDIITEAVQNEIMSHSESIVQVAVLPNMNGSNFENFEVSFPSDTASTMATTQDNVIVEDGSSLNDSVSQSSQIHIMGVLEEIIAEARNNKKTLFSAMESVISLMREVELKEQAAEEAKEEASKGGIGVLDKLEELKQMLKHAKEANDMHAGEVYGERSILATELRELQSRVLYLSDERDKSLAVLDEMRQSLEMRLAEAENEIISAEQEKLRKNMSARKALSGQECLMVKVVQESNILKQQAEENAKLREFLVDRGCVVDTLQGEIAVISHDVKLLTEKVDDRVPLSKSCSSCNTSSILASSSSLKSSNPDQVELVPVLDNSINNQQLIKPVTQVFADEAARYDREALLEEGWEFFDHLEK